MLKSLARVQVLILDDWGLTPLNAEQRRDLLEIVDDRHGRASTKTGWCAVWRRTPEVCTWGVGCRAVEGLMWGGRM
jgi:hypothetical protein